MINSAKFTTASCLIGNHLLDVLWPLFSQFLNGLAPVTDVCWQPAKTYLILTSFDN